MPAVGNHEMETGYGPQGYDGHFARFTLPKTGAEGAPATYWFRYSNVAFVALDANDVSYEIPANLDYTNGAQDAWLRGILAEARADPNIDFIVIGYHHCSYCSNAVHGSDGGVRERWGALFDEFSVDLVINGHNHCYERSHPLRGGAVVQDAPGGTEIDPTKGTTYVTAGGGGQTAYQAALHPVSYVTVEPAPISPTGTRPLNPLRIPESALWSAARYLDLSLIVVDVEPRDASGIATMKIKALQVNGDPIEEVTLRRARAARDAAA